MDVNLSDSLMKYNTLNITVDQPFGNLCRKQSVLVAARVHEGKILVGAKPYMYPPGITRLLGGGVHENEDFRQAAVRELKEELRVVVSAKDLHPLVGFHISGVDVKGQVYASDIEIYFIDIANQPYRAGDDVESVVALTLDEVDELGLRYSKLPQTLWYNGPEGIYSWADYAKVYGPLHRIVAREIEAIIASTWRGHRFPRRPGA